MVAVDTSVAIPLLLESHEAHDLVRGWATGRKLGLCGHALAETYSVLTRLPGDARVEAHDAVSLIDGSFIEILPLSPALASDAHRVLAQLGIAGGATYDGLVALTARDHDVALATRDARARPTYERLGIEVELISSSSESSR